VPKTDLLPIRNEAPSTKANIFTNKATSYYILTEVNRPAAIVMPGGNIAHGVLGTA
jgi:hypothetical protein